MSPEERLLLERTLKLSEENNQILLSMKRRIYWAFLWGVIKILIIAIPLVIGYLYLEPYFGSFGQTFQDAQGIIQLLK